MSLSLRTALIGALTIIASACPAVASADIQATAATAETCTDPALVQPFSIFGDQRDYVLAPGGSFEGKTLEGWQVTDAKTTGDASPLGVSSNDRSLTIPAGGSATSPAMCVDLYYPTFRMMERVPTAGALLVEVAYPDSDNPVFHQVGMLASGGDRDWAATGDMPVLPERGGVEPGMRRVALRFTSLAVDDKAGDWKIDDVYIDPRRL